MERQAPGQSGRVTSTIVIVMTIVALGAAFWAWGGAALLSRQRFTQENIDRLKYPATRGEEARRLGRDRVREAVGHIAPLLHADEVESRRAAAWALAEIGTPSAARFLRKAADDADPQVRAQVARGLGRAAVPVPSEELDRLLEDPQVSVRAAAAGALGHVTGSPEAIASRLSRALSDPSAEVRKAAVNALGRRDVFVAWRPALEATEDSDPGVAKAARQMIRRRSNGFHGVALGGLRREPSVSEAAELVKLLGVLGEKRGATVILQELDVPDKTSEDEVAVLVDAAVGALLGIGKPAIEAIVSETILEEASLPAERAAAMAAERIGQASVRPVVKGILQWRVYPSAAELVRWVQVLGRLGDPAANAALNFALAQGIDGMEQHVAAARGAIEKARGRPLPPPRPTEGLLAGTPGEGAYGSIRPGGVLVTPPNPQGNTIPDNGVVKLVLKGALLSNTVPGQGGSFDLHTHVARRDGKWDADSMAWSTRFNKRSFDFRIRGHRREGDSILLDVEVIYRDDHWRKCAYGEYSISLTPGRANMDARYEGHCNFGRCAGKVEVVSWRHDWPSNALPPLEAGMHPRLPFRPGDVQALRERAKTPFGRKVIAALRRRIWRTGYRTPLNYVTNWEAGADSASGHGFLAVLFGDRRHGQRGAAMLMPRTQRFPYLGEHGERLPGPMSHYPMAYDLCHHALTDKEFREVIEVRAYVRMAFPLRTGPGGVFSAHRGTYAIPAMGCLALLGEKGPFFYPKPYVPPEVIAFEPEQDLPGGEVAVNEWRPGEPIRQWLVAGPVEAGGKKEPAKSHPLAELGGPAALKAVPGSEFTHKGRTVRFGPVGKEPSRELRGMETQSYMLELPVTGAQHRNFLYTVVEVGKDVTFAVPSRRRMGNLESKLYVNGVRVPFRAVVKLKEGRHRLLVEAAGPIVGLDYRAARYGYAKALRERFEYFSAQYEEARRIHRVTGQMPSLPETLRLCESGVRQAMLTEQEKVERNGGKGYRSGAWMWPYAFSQFMATGQGLYPDTPLPVASMPDRIRPRDLRDEQLVYSLALVPDSRKPALKAEFDRRFLPDGLTKLGCMELVAAFVGYPLEKPE
ncbi:MAG: HEAT repeat domain-containing protein [Phycisphaerae bacterium]